MLPSANSLPQSQSEPSNTRRNTVGGRSRCTSASTTSVEPTSSNHYSVYATLLSSMAVPSSLCSERVVCFAPSNKPLKLSIGRGRPLAA